MKQYSYSKKNEYPFVLPAEYKAILDGTAGKGGAAAKKGSKLKKKRGFDFMRVIRIGAFLIMIVALIILVDKEYQYLRDVQYAEAQNRTIAINAQAMDVAEKRATPAYPDYEGSNANKNRFEYPQVLEKESLTQFGTAYPDFTFWIFIENTFVNYPVVQAPDNDFYLHRNMDGETNISGTLFLDYRCDPVTMMGHNIIYGHNMQNGTMFGLLKNYVNKSYYDQHSVIYTYTPEAVTAWKIFSAYETDTNNYYIETNFKTPARYQNFLDKLKSDSAYDTGVEVTYEDDILTLSTCHFYTKSNGRFVVHAVKIGTTPMV
ncbi:MAG: class B sortase [Clostridia bacterium]|nr:class B sortase [Clostridia bacterium]